MGSQELGCNGSTYSIGVALSERTAGVLHTADGVELGMSRRRRAPLPQLGQFLKAVSAYQTQLAVEHGSHVTGVEEETVAPHPRRVLGVILQIFAEKHIDEVGTSHGSAGMSALGLLYGTCSQNTDVVGCMVHYG